jgi:hypothetical protein
MRIMRIWTIVGAVLAAIAAGLGYGVGAHLVRAGGTGPALVGLVAAAVLLVVAGQVLCTRVGTFVTTRQVQKEVGEFERGVSHVLGTLGQAIKPAERGPDDSQGENK